MVDSPNSIWRDYSTYGVPSSGLHNPLKSKIRGWAAWVDAGLNAGTLNGPWKATKSALDSDLAYDADTVGFVYETADIGTYVKSGASGSGSWTKELDFIPGFQLALATDDGGSTANAHTMDTAPRASTGDGVTLIRGFWPETNTSTTVTIAFDGGTALAVKTQANNNPAIGGLVQGAPFIGQIAGSGTEFRLLSDQTGTAIQTAAENAQAYAEEWANKAEDSPVSVAAGGDGSTEFSARHWAAKAAAALGSDLIVKDHAELAALTSSDVAVGNVVWLKELGGAVERVTANEDLDYTGAGGLKYQVLPIGGEFDVKMFGAVGDNATDDTAAAQQAMVACGRERVSILFFPPNNAGAGYEIDGTTLRVPPGLTRLIIRGAGIYSSVLVFKNMTLEQFMIDFDKAPTDVSYFWGIEDIQLFCANNTTANAVRVRNVAHLHMRNVYIPNAYRGVVFTNEYATITGATQANPVVISASAGHPFVNGQLIIIDDIVGMTELNGRQFAVANVTANTFELAGEDGTGHSPYSSGGFAVESASTFSNLLDNVTFGARAPSGPASAQGINQYAVEFDHFRGGGHYTFKHCTFSGEIGIVGDVASNVTQLALLSCNFEQCETNDFRWDGNLRGFSAIGMRSEGLFNTTGPGVASILLTPGTNKLISGVFIAGGQWSCDAGAIVPLYLNSNGGDVKGFAFVGNTLLNAGVGTQFVTLAGAGEAGVIEGNHGEGVMAGAVNGPRAGVRVQNNSDANGPLREYTGTEGAWTPTDQSGAGLTLVAAVGEYVVLGERVFYSGYVTYPTTVDTNKATLSLPINTDGSIMSRAGGIVTYANVTAQAFQGFPGAAQLRILNQLDGTDITNADLSGRTIYLSGSYIRA